MTVMTIYVTTKTSDNAERFCCCRCKTKCNVISLHPIFSLFLSSPFSSSALSPALVAARHALRRSVAVRNCGSIFKPDPPRLCPPHNVPFRHRSVSFSRLVACVADSSITSTIFQLLIRLHLHLSITYLFITASQYSPLNLTEGLLDSLSSSLRSFSAFASLTCFSRYL